MLVSGAVKAALEKPPKAAEVHAYVVERDANVRFTDANDSLTQRDIQNHHQRKAGGKSEHTDIGVLPGRHFRD